MIEPEILRAALEHHRGKEKPPKNRKARVQDRRRMRREFSTDPGRRQAREKIISILDETPDICRKKVASVKNRLKRGTLGLDSKRLAERILRESILEELL